MVVYICISLIRFSFQLESELARPVLPSDLIDLHHALKNHEVGLYIVGLSQRESIYIHVTSFD